MQHFEDTGVVDAREEKRKRQRRKWDREHLRSVGTKLCWDDYRRFKKMCKAAGMSTYAVLKEYILRIIEQPYD